MALFFVNNKAQPNGDHEVHKEGCEYLAKAKSVTKLGDYLRCQSAVVAAKQIYAKSNGCYFCSRECHTS